MESEGCPASRGLQGVSEEFWGAFQVVSEKYQEVLGALKGVSNQSFKRSQGVSWESKGSQRVSEYFRETLFLRNAL